MPIICPAILAENPHIYREQIERVASFASRIQIDLTDGKFAAARTISLEQAWWPDDIRADLHLMYERPNDYFETILALKPHMVIVHAESEPESLADLFNNWENKAKDIKLGIALLPKTMPDARVSNWISQADHIMLFSGDLGKYGGTTDLSLLKKIKTIRDINPSIEIGWDGGANKQNIKTLVNGGVDVVNVGGALQRASNPESVYRSLCKLC